jgi:hypothetical protein
MKEAHNFHQQQRRPSINYFFHYNLNTMAFTQEMRTAGSKKGYYADIDNSSSSSSDDDASSSRSVRGYCIPSSETTVSAAASTEGASYSSSSSSLPSSQFYTDVQPRRRRHSRCQRHQQFKKFKNITRQTQQDATHPDIDLSLVSLLTSREHDRRQFKKLQKALRLHHRGNITLPERLQRHSSSHHKPKNTTCHQVNKDAIEDESFSSSSSPSSSSESDRYCNNIIKTDHEYSKALSKPLKNDRPIAVIDYGSVQFGQLGSVLDSIYKIGGEEGADEKSNRRSFGGDTFLVDSHDVKSAANFSTHQPALTVASSRSSDVAAVIASLKNPSADLKRKAHYEDCSSAKKIKFLPTAVVHHKTDTTTLEDAVAFSPYARVLFTADFPQTVVHINAAYCALVKKGFAKPCALGHPLTTTNIERRSYEDSSKLNGEFAAKIVNNDLGISTKDINYQLFPIISGDESFCDYSRTHCSYELGETAEEGEGDHVHRHVSHYLLQIEPVALS